MSQNWTSNLYTVSTLGDTTLTNMELMFETLRTCFSGSSSPSNPIAGKLWYDSTKKNTKRRNSANSGWHGLMSANTSQKVWLYRNDAMEGWIVDTGVTDKVLAIKGGSTYVTGGVSAGNWSLSHTHTTGDFTLTTSHIPAHTHHIQSSWFVSGSGYPAKNFETQYSGTFTELNTGYTGGGNAHNHGATGDGPFASTWRPNAAVGTLQYMDL